MLIQGPTDPPLSASSSFVLIGLALGALAVGTALARYALDALSRPRLFQGLSDPARRTRYATFFDRLDRTRMAVSVIWVALEALLVLVTGAAFAAATDRPPLAWQVLVPTLLTATLFLLVFCRILPRLLVARDFNGATRAALPVLHAIGVALAPVAGFFLVLRRGLSRALGLTDKETLDEQFTEEIIATVAEGEREGIVGEDEAEMIENVVQFREFDVAEVMTPRTDIDWIEANETVFDALRLAAEHGHSRLPVGEEDADHIVGVFYVRDVIHRLDDLAELKNTPVKELCRKAYFVPETKLVSALLKEFRANKLQIAIVLDEYGGTAGLITIEDIVEQIVGDIADEYDAAAEEPALRLVDANVAEVDGRAHIDEINEALDIALPESDDFDTLGGFVFSTLGRVPQPGESMSWDGVELRVLDADERRVKRVEVRVLSRETQESA